MTLLLILGGALVVLAVRPRLGRRRHDRLRARRVRAWTARSRWCRR